MGTEAEASRLRTRRDELAQRVSELSERVETLDAGLERAKRFADASEAEVADEPDDPPATFVDVLTDAVGAGFAVGTFLLFVVPIIAIVGAVVGVVHGIASCGDGTPVHASWTGTLLADSGGARAASPCRVALDGSLDAKRCRLVVTCDGRVLHEGEARCERVERANGVDDDGNESTTSVLVAHVDGASVDDGTGVAELSSSVPPARVLLHHRHDEDGR